MTEPPWMPVAPKTTRIFFADMFYVELALARIAMDASEWDSRVTGLGANGLFLARKVGAMRGNGI